MFILTIDSDDHIEVAKVLKNLLIEIEQSKEIYTYTSKIFAISYEYKFLVYQPWVFMSKFLTFDLK